MNVRRFVAPLLAATTASAVPAFSVGAAIAVMLVPRVAAAMPLYIIAD